MKSMCIPMQKEGRSGIRFLLFYFAASSLLIIVVSFSLVYSRKFLRNASTHENVKAEGFKRACALRL